MFEFVIEGQGNGCTFGYVVNTVQEKNLCLTVMIKAE